MKIGVSVRLAPAPFLHSALDSEDIDFVETAIEEFAYRTDVASKKRLERMLRHKPVAVHGYSLSLLDPQDRSDAGMKRYFDFMRSYPFLALSDHYAVSSWRGKLLGSLTPAPVGAEAHSILHRKLDRIQKELPSLPFFLENVASPFKIDPSATSMVEHFKDALCGTHAQVLLDISNLVANELNFGINAESELDLLLSLPIGEVHLAGGHWESGFFRDSHSASINSRSWELLKRAAPRLPSDCLILIEWEQQHPEWSLMKEQITDAKRTLGL